MASKEALEIVVNGEPRELAVDPGRTLLDLLRDDLGLTGTKRGCDDASCGACTVLVDGRAHLSCIGLALCHDGARVLTVEGASPPGGLNAIQASLVSGGGLQCGYCTPGIVLAARALVDRNPSPTPAEVREGISNNLCRCTGYERIIDAVLAALPHLAPAGAGSPGPDTPGAPGRRGETRS
jgi:carbon-monoxide dehydrogenase small subunit